MIAIAIAGFFAASALAGSSHHCPSRGACHRRTGHHGKRRKECRVSAGRRHGKRRKRCEASHESRCPKRGCKASTTTTTANASTTTEGTTTTTGTTATGTTTAVTTGTTTTTTTTTTASAQPTWQSETDYLAPVFTPQQTIDVSTLAGFWKAWNVLQPGDEINVHGVAFLGETVFKKQLPDWAEVHFDAGTTFVGTPGQNLPAAWIDGCQHIRFYGGTLTNPIGGSGVTIYDSSYFSWWGFDIHDTANTGLFVQGINSVNDHLDLKGEISDWGLNLALDPHSEKGTGLHGANLADARYGVRDSRFALYLHNGAAGSGVEAGGASSTDGFWNNTLYLRCQNLSMVATSQVGGNCFQAWGDNVVGNDFPYIEAENLEGRAYDANGMYAGQALTTDTVDYGRATDTNLNPALSSTEWGVSSADGWDTRNGTKFVDIGQQG
jgi:hypothetical protein